MAQLAEHRLTLADPVCNSSDCTVSFAVTVPFVNVTLATDGGSAAASGAAGAQVDSEAAGR